MKRTKVLVLTRRGLTKYGLTILPVSRTQRLNINKTALSVSQQKLICYKMCTKSLYSYLFAAMQTGFVPFRHNIERRT